MKNYFWSGSQSATIFGFFQKWGAITVQFLVLLITYFYEIKTQIKFHDYRELINQILNVKKKK